MLKTYGQGRAQATIWAVGEPINAAALWLDLIDPTDAERATIESLIEMPLPQRDDISGLGLSSQQAAPDRVLSLHARLYGDRDGSQAAPIAMLVMRERLITLRYAPSAAIDDATGRLAAAKPPLDGSNVLLMLLEAIGNDVAGRMQAIASDMATLSGDVFSDQRERTRTLRDKLLRIGRLEGQLARYRTSLLGIGRVAGFVSHRPPSWFDQDAVSGAKVVVNDLATLDEFEDQLTDKLEFLQDAVLGFISTDQNAVMKIFTAASVATIPPVILAGVWGMNFKHMPELDVPWAYPVALAVMALSIAVPLVWFGLLGWLSRD